MTLVDGNQIQLENGNVLPLPRGVHNFRRFGDYYEYVFPFDECRETYTRHLAARGSPILAITKERDVHCVLDETVTVLTLPAGTFASHRPIAQVIQVSTYFVIGMRNALSMAPSPIICLAPDGSIVWEYPAEYSGVSPLKDSPNVVTGKCGTTYIIAAGSGSIVSRQQDR